LPRWDTWINLRAAPCGLLQEEVSVNPFIWLPALFLLGLATMGLFFAFASGCEKV
jgi:hypothetical protein